MSTSLEQRLDELEATAARLQKRLTELEDDKQIREVLSRYGFTADGGRDQEYVDLYTDDGSMNSITTMAFGSGYDGAIVFNGKNEIMNFITDPKAHKAIQGRCMHIQGNNLATVISEDEARASSYSFVLIKTSESDESISIRSSGFNVWTLKKTDGKWLIKERMRRPIGTREAHELLQQMPA